MLAAYNAAHERYHAEEEQHCHEVGNVQELQLCLKLLDLRCVGPPHMKCEFKCSRRVADAERPRARTSRISSCCTGSLLGRLSSCTGISSVLALSCIEAAPTAQQQSERNTTLTRVIDRHAIVTS
jgi:hypothetical protein